MPKIKYFEGREVKKTARFEDRGRVFIRVTLVGPRGTPGAQVVVTEAQYQAGLEATYVPPAVYKAARRTR